MLAGLAGGLILLWQSCCDQPASGRRTPRPCEDQYRGRAVDCPSSRRRPLRCRPGQEHQEAWAKYLGVPVEITNSIGMKLVLIPPGEFVMGDGGDAHKVRITKPFYLGKYEVTQAEWEAVMGKQPEQVQGGEESRGAGQLGGLPDFPEEAGEKCDVRRGVIGCRPKRNGSMPAGRERTGKWCFGDNEASLDDYAWYERTRRRRRTRWARRSRTPGGCTTCTGTLEWCADWFDEDYYKDRR